MKYTITTSVKLLFLISSLLLIFPASYGQAVVLQDYEYEYVREMGSFQADWYSFTIDEPSFVNLTIITNYQTDDVGFYVYEEDLFTTYDPDIQYIPIAGVRNFWFTNYAMMNLGLYAPGTYTLQVIGFSMFPNTPNADFGPYLLQTSTPLTYRYSTWFNTLSMSGLPSTYPSHVNVSFLGHLYSEEVDTGIAGWMDHGSTIHASRSIEVTESERYSTSAATSFTILGVDDLHIHYYHQYKFTPSIENLDLFKTTPIITYSYSGDSISEPVDRATDYWSDANIPLSVSKIVDVSSYERYFTQDETVFPMTNPVNAQIDYYHQWLTEINLRGVSDTSVDYMYLGDRHSKSITDNWNGWVDDSTDLVLSSIVLSDEDSARYTVPKNIFPIISSETIDVNYIKQYEVTIAAAGLDQSFPTTISYVSNDQSNQGFFSNTWTTWVDSDSSILLSENILGQPGERWIIDSNSHYNVIGSDNYHVNYIKQSLLSIEFFNSNDILLNQSPDYVILTSGHNRLEISKFDNIWIFDGTWNIDEVYWNGIDLVPLDKTFKTYPGAIWNVKNPIYNLIFKVGDVGNNPISNTKVYVTMPNGDTKLESTNSEGIVKFVNVPDGEYSLSLSSLGQNVVQVGNVSQDSASVQELNVIFSVQFIITLGVVTGIIALSYWNFVIRTNKSETVVKKRTLRKK